MSPILFSGGPTADSNVNRAIPLNEQRGDAALSPVTPSPVSGSFTSALAEASTSELRARKPTEASESAAAVKKAERKVTRAKLSKEDEERYKSYGFWSDLRSGKWMLIPSTSPSSPSRDR